VSDSTDQAQPPTDDEVREALMRRYDAQTAAAIEQSTFWQGQAKLWRRIALGFAVAIAVLAVVAVLFYNATHHEGVLGRQKADQVLTIARQFECQQTPRPKGCPPTPPPAPNPQTQQAVEQIVDRVIARIVALYPPPHAP